MILVTPHCTGIVLLRSVMCWKLLYNIHGLSFNSLLVDKFLWVLKNKEWGPASFSDKSVPCQLWMGGMVGITNDDLESEVLWTFMCSALIIFLLLYPCTRGLWGPSVGRLGWCAHCRCWSAGHWGCHWRFSGPLVRGLEVIPSCHHSEGNYFHVLPLGRMVSGQMLGHGILLISEVVLRSVPGRVPKHQLLVSSVHPVISPGAV